MEKSREKQVKIRVTSNVGEYADEKIIIIINRKTR